MGKGRTVKRGKESDEFEQGTKKAANPARELTTEGSGESAQSREAPNLHNGFIRTRNPEVSPPVGNAIHDQTKYFRYTYCYFI
jgi:hypothetical protein